MRHKLLMLGAGPNQVPAIRKAVELGFYVITADYLPENVGHKHSDLFVDCSTVDKAATLKAARELEIDGIVTFASDVATPAVGFVAEQLSLPGCTARAAETMSSKARFRRLQRKHGLSCPRFAIGRTYDELEPKLASLNPPLIFKPVDASGSRGITQVDAIDRKRCAEAFEYAFGYSRSETVCVEESVEGIEVGGDGFLVNGRLEFAAITHKHRRGFVVTGHSLPTNISAEDQERVRVELTANCSAAGYTDGPLNFDVMVSPIRVTVLEMSPRLGGNGIPEIIARATAVDLITAALCFSVGKDVELPRTVEITRSCGSWVFGSDRPGMLEGIATEHEIKTTVPQVFKYAANRTVGEIVPAFVHNGDSLGYVLFDCPHPSSYHDMVSQLDSALHLHVSPCT